MASNISAVDLAGLNRTAASQAEAVQAGRAQIQALISQGHTLATGWQGQAATAFNSALDELGAQGQRLMSSLDAMEQLMRSTEADFAATHGQTHQQAVALGHTVASAAPAGLPGL
jgi:uncharacterized protein YukE